MAQLIVAGGFDQLHEWVKKYVQCFVKRYAIMGAGIGLRLGVIPAECHTSMQFFDQSWHLDNVYTF